ncbi:unnamed protein product [Thlaspi arvense]|uniref:RING-type domain-containing protein n=1 Tax=Thlaspi arvense TaxID=13288 RepID=A0AAU9S9B0_THLAR|nr:unnamed protein product [Thlaspi arvense]
MASSSTANQPQTWLCKCYECEFILGVIPLTRGPPTRTSCLQCNNIFTSFNPSNFLFELSDDEPDAPLEPIPETLPCPICMEDVVEGEETAQRLPCNHLFHNDCINPWLRNHSTCPLCRFVIPVEVSDDESSSSEEVAPEGDLEVGHS